MLVIKWAHLVRKIVNFKTMFFFASNVGQSVLFAWFRLSRTGSSSSQRRAHRRTQRRAQRRDQFWIQLWIQPRTDRPRQNLRRYFNLVARTACGVV